MYEFIDHAQLAGAFRKSGEDVSGFWVSGFPPSRDAMAGRFQEKRFLLVEGHDPE